MKTTTLWLVLTSLLLTACKPTPPPPQVGYWERNINRIVEEVKTEQRKQKWNDTVDQVVDTVKFRKKHWWEY